MTVPRLKVILLVASPADDSNDVTGGSNVYSKPLFSADVVTLLSNLRLDKIESKALSPAVICFVTSDVKRLKTLACSVELTKVVFLMVAVAAVFITVSSFDKSNHDNGDDDDGDKSDDDKNDDRTSIGDIDIISGC